MLVKTKDNRQTKNVHRLYTSIALITFSMSEVFIYKNKKYTVTVNKVATNDKWRLNHKDWAKLTLTKLHCQYYAVQKLSQNIHFTKFLNIAYIIQGGPKNSIKFCMPITSSNINRFSKFFHWWNQQKICSNINTKDCLLYTSDAADE